MAALSQSLRKVLDVAGVRTAALVDIGTGMVVCSAGDGGAAFPAAAEDLSGEARSALSAFGPARQGGDLEEVAVITESRFLLSKIVASRPGEGLLLFVDLDRAQTNMALASWQVGQAASALLA
jgi:hypothetical protein